MKVAIVHDWLTGVRGGEKCLLEFLRMYPEADVHTLLWKKGSVPIEIERRIAGTSVLQRLPWIGTTYRYFLPFYPIASKTLSLKNYDLVISLSHAAAKNVSVDPSAFHICFCFTPMRYIWDQAPVYWGKMAFLLAPVLKSLQVWDVRGAERVNSFVAISQFVRKRIRQYYQREAAVIYPPVEMEQISVRAEIPSVDAPFLCAGALVPYKRIEIAVKAFNELGLPLRIAGSGPSLAALKREANENITFLGFVTDAELYREFRESQALIFPGVEDFGMVPVECMASGTPIIAVRDGGVFESVSSCGAEATGVFYDKGSDAEEVQNLIRAVKHFLSIRESMAPARCRSHAERFSPEVFRASWKSFMRKSGFAIEPEAKAASC